MSGNLGREISEECIKLWQRNGKAMRRSEEKSEPQPVKGFQTMTTCSSTILTLSSWKLEDETRFKVADGRRATFLLPMKMRRTFLCFGTTRD